MTTNVAVVGMGCVEIPIAALLADTDIFQVTGIQRRSKRSEWKINFGFPSSFSYHGVDQGQDH